MIRYHNTVARRFPRSTQEAFSWERSNCLYGPYTATKTRLSDLLLWFAGVAVLIALLFTPAIGRALGWWS
jgi:hypothetical protein